MNTYKKTDYPNSNNFLRVGGICLDIELKWWKSGLCDVCLLLIHLWLLCLEKICVSISVPFELLVMDYLKYIVACDGYFIGMGSGSCINHSNTMIML